MAFARQGFRLWARPLTLAVVLALGVVATACGDDDDGGGDAAVPAESGGGSTEALCAVEEEIDGPFDEAGQYATREQKQAAAQAVVDGGLLEDAEAAAPSLLAGAVETRVAAIRSAAQGMTEALISTEALDASQQIDNACAALAGGGDGDGY